MASLRSVAPIAAIALAAAASLSASSPASAQDTPRAVPTEAQRLIDEARRLYAELDFALAIDAAQRALATPGLADAERASALETLACAYVVLEREASARQAFESLFRLDPYWLVREPSGSPRIQRIAESVRARIAPDAALDPNSSLRLELPRGARTGRPIVLEAHAEGADPASVAVRVRGEGQTEWARVEGHRTSAGRFAIELPPRDDAEEIELYAEARDERGRLFARAGGPLVPFRLPVRASGDEGLGEPLWIGLGIGAGVVAAIGVAIAIGVATASPERAPPGTLPPGRVELPLFTFD